jgi:ABC-type multidrug transport system ATPase subunit
MSVPTQRYAIEARELCKVYRSFWKVRVVRALNGFSLQVREGSAVGLIGPAGSGKTTFVKILRSMIQPDSGGVSIFGAPAGRDSVRSLYSFREAFDGRRLSSGDVLVIDGNVAAVDTRMTDQFAQWRALGATILVCSRSLAEVEPLCNEVAIVRNGRIVEAGPWQDLVATGGFRIFVGPRLADDLQTHLTARGCAIGWSGDTCWIQSANHALQQEVIDEVLSFGVQIQRLERLAPRLQRLPLRTPEGNDRGGENREGICDK